MADEEEWDPILDKHSATADAYRTTDNRVAQAHSQTSFSPPWTNTIRLALPPAPVPSKVNSLPPFTLHGQSVATGPNTAMGHEVSVGLSASQPREFPLPILPFFLHGKAYKTSYRMLTENEWNQIVNWATTTVPNDRQLFYNAIRDDFALPPRPYTKPSGGRSEDDPPLDDRFWTKQEILLLIYEFELGIFSSNNNRRVPRPQPWKIYAWTSVRLAEWGYSRPENGIEKIKSRLYITSKETPNLSWLTSAPGLVHATKMLVEHGTDIDPMSSVDRNVSNPISVLPIEKPIQPGQQLTWGIPENRTYKGVVW